MARYVGIVLKHLDSPYKIALLDRERGRVDAIITKKICVGSLLEYSIDRERGNYLFLSSYVITDLPFYVGRQDILFWHHVLELCFYFVPIGYNINPLFELLLFLYTVDSNVQWEQQSKKLYLFKLLAAIGLYEALPHLVPETRVKRLLALPVQESIYEQLDEKSEQVVNQWLRMCIAENPYLEKFNTVHFLGNVEAHE